MRLHVTTIDAGRFFCEKLESPQKKLLLHGVRLFRKPWRKDRVGVSEGAGAYFKGGKQ